MFSGRRLLWAAAFAAGAAAAAFGSWEDGFDGPELDGRWQWRVPAAGPAFSLAERPGWLRIRLPERNGGYNHWNEPQPVDEAPQLRAPVPEGDWDLEARVQLQDVPADGHFLAGLEAVLDDGLLVTFGAFQGPSLPGGPKTPEACLEPTGLSGFCRAAGDWRDLRLRLERRGTLCRAQASRDGTAWVDVGAYLMGASPRAAGLIGKTFANGKALVFDVDYVRLTQQRPWRTQGRRALVAVGGEYPTGYRGLLARLGLPYEILVDYQLGHLETLGRFDLLLVSGRRDTVSDAIREAIMAYVRSGGIAVLDSGFYPLASVVAGKGGPAQDLPDIVVGGAGNPLMPFLGNQTRFAAGESRYHYEPASLDGLQLLARFDGRPGRQGKAEGYTGTPAVWARPLGRGLFVYSSPAIGATLSWGPAHDALAEALIRCLGGGRLEPQLTPEGVRFGRKQSELTESSVAAAGAAPPPAPFRRGTPEAPAEELPGDAVALRGKAAPEFNLSGVYRPDQGKAVLLANYWNRRWHVSATFRGGSVRLSRIEDGRTTDTSETGFEAGAEVPFVLKERRDRIVLRVGGRSVAVSAQGLWEGKLGSSGAALAGLRYQPVEPPYLADDFMRGEKEQGAWETLGGEWSVRAKGDPRMGANPFTCLAKAKGAGLAAAGLPFWDEYAFAVSARPARAGGWVGQAFYLRGREDLLLFRVRVGDPGADAGGGAEIVRVREGKETVLGRGDASLAPGQWYRLGVQVRDGVAAGAVDGRQTAAAETGDLHEGKVGLWVRDAEAEFDDALVQPAAEAARTGLVELDGSVPRFAGTLDRDTWAGTALQWRAAPGVPGLFWRRGCFLGDFRLVFRCDLPEPAPGADASLALLLTPEDRTLYESCRATLRRTPGGPAGSCRLELLAAGLPARRRDIAVEGTPQLELRRTGSRLGVFLGDQEMLACDLGPAAGRWPQLGFLAAGFKPRLSGLRLEAGCVLDYCFDRAPADWWVGSGAWELAVRWPCTPEWSWLAGESRQVAALWHKRSFAGDIVVDLHVGPRTVDHGDGQPPREICRAFNLVICGDGQDVRSGYSVVVGADKQGAGATLSRLGKVVADNPAFRIFSDAHNQWLNVRAEKRAAAVAVWVGDQCILSWEDPEPLPGGRVAIWTVDNAIMVPRVTIYHRAGESGGAG